MEAPEPTPTFNAPDADGKAKLDKVRHLDIHDASACLAV
jgi:hypothetical protein